MNYKKIKKIWNVPFEVALFVDIIVNSIGCTLISFIGGFMYNKKQVESGNSTVMDNVKLPLIFAICLVATGIMYSLLPLIG